MIDPLVSVCAFVILILQTTVPGDVEVERELLAFVLDATRNPAVFIAAFTPLFCTPPNLTQSFPSTVLDLSFDLPPRSPPRKSPSGLPREERRQDVRSGYLFRQPLLGPPQQERWHGPSTLSPGTSTRTSPGMIGSGTSTAAISEVAKRDVDECSLPWYPSSSSSDSSAASTIGSSGASSRPAEARGGSSTVSGVVFLR